jgi:hypothetical protein
MILVQYSTSCKHNPCGGAVGPDLDRSQECKIAAKSEGLILLLPTITRVPTMERTMYLRKPVPRIVKQRSPAVSSLCQPAVRICLTVDVVPSVGLPKAAKSWVPVKQAAASIKESKSKE